jgi:hypothetical protein
MEKEGAFAMHGDLCCACMHNSKIEGSTRALLPRHVIFFGLGRLNVLVQFCS